MNPKMQDFARLCSTHGVSISEGIATAVLDQVQEPIVQDVAALLYGPDVINRLNEGRFVPTIIGELQ